VVSYYPMKPNELKRPFVWKEREIALIENILYVPDRCENYASFVLPGWKEIFGNDNPVHVEYCSGNGHWIIERAQRDPNINWVAVEKRFDRVRKINSKRQNAGLKNLFIVCGAGMTATEYYFESKSVAGCFVNFPDPWPKRRHAKHRIISDPFLQQVTRILAPGGQLTLVTDDPDCSDQMIDTVGRHPVFSFKNQCYQTEKPGYGDSWFESLWRSLGRQIRYHEYELRSPLVG
jgi:tRNA (guanine-N7-)-methyltransferase